MTQSSLTISQSTLSTARDMYSLCKPRVTALIAFTALAGFLVASPAPDAIVLICALFGISLVSGSAAVLNALLEITSDAKMRRTKRRPLPSGRVTVAQASVFCAAMALTGFAILYSGTNALTMWLALGSFLGYAIVYTLILKPNTSQNIVIGGAAGAMPPVLGWSAATNSVGLEAGLLFLIIFVWTPPHFWSLALYYRKDYAAGGFPMLPVTRGSDHTRLNILVYTCALFGISLLPFFAGFANGIYLLLALILGALFLLRAFRLYRAYSDARALMTFKYSIIYLFVLFASLIVDRYFAIEISI